MSTFKVVSRECWCAKGVLLPFSDDYAICRNCQTLVSQKGLSDENLQVQNDDNDFYGKNYWLSHQSEDLTQPDIFQRARDDLSERCLHWLETLLKYKLPTARVLELGCAHGGFVAMMRTLNYDAMGLELSPWIVDFARKSFDIPVVLGDIASQNFEPNSFDVIALMDVFEHLPNPKETISHCLNALKPEGILLIQTPSYPVGISHDDLKKKDHMFLKMLQTDEHLYLFNPDAAQTFFKEFGVNHIAFEPAIFHQYDMFFVASRSPLMTNSAEAIENLLNSSTQGQIIQSMLDARKHLQIVENDRAARLDNINTLTYQLEMSQKENLLLKTAQTEGLKQINELTLRCQNVEKNRQAYVTQVNTLTKQSQEAAQQYKALDNNRQTLLAQMNELTQRCKKAEGNTKAFEDDRKTLVTQIDTLTQRCKKAESNTKALEDDRKTLITQIDTLTQRCQKAEGNTKAFEDDRKAHLTQIETLTKRSQDAEQKYENLDEHRQTLLAQMNELTQRCQKAENNTKAFEDDRKTLVTQIDTLTQRCQKAESNTKAFEDDRKTLVTQIDTLTQRCQKAESNTKAFEDDRKTLITQIDTLTQRCQKAESNTKAFEDNRKTLITQIDTLTTRCHETELHITLFKEDQQAHLEQIHYLTKQLAISEEDRAARLKVIEALSAQVG